VSVEPFEAVIREHGDAVLRVCRSLLGPEDAEDAWADTFVAALAAYPRLRPGSNVRGWLVTIAHNVCVDRLRRRAHERAEPFDAEDDRSGHEQVVLDPGLWAAVRALPEKQRAAVALHYLADLPHSEAGSILGISEAASRRAASDGIAKLRLTYGKEEKG
jgi:RNA polymerase sigma factor (sigma-70 family)